MKISQKHATFWIALDSIKDVCALLDNVSQPIHENVVELERSCSDRQLLASVKLYKVIKSLHLSFYLNFFSFLFFYTQIYVRLCTFLNFKLTYSAFHIFYPNMLFPRTGKYFCSYVFSSCTVSYFLFLYFLFHPCGSVYSRFDLTCCWFT